MSYSNFIVYLSNNYNTLKVNTNTNTKINDGTNRGVWLFTLL